MVTRPRPRKDPRLPDKPPDRPLAPPAPSSEPAEGRHEAAMHRAVALSREAMRAGGGPFGAVVVLDGAVVGEGANRVVPDGDPTAHAEVVAIRDACERLGTHDLSGAVIYASCEPCPMCLGAIWWARIGAIYYGNSRAEAAAIGFDDATIYEEVCRPIAERALPLERLGVAEAAEVFTEWEAMAGRRRY